MQCIALTLIYDPRITRTDLETGQLVEFGYVQPGEPIDLSDESATILIGLGYVQLASSPEPVTAPVLEPQPDPQPKALTGI